MFRKHDDSLQRLNEELLAEEEYDEEEYEEEYEDYDEEFAEASEEEEGSEETEDELFYRNHANGYGSGIRNYANRYGRGSPKAFDYLGEEEELEDEAYLDRKGYRKAGRKKNRKNLGWVIIAFLEVLAIAAIAVWWASWML